MREGRPELIGKFGKLARRWLGENAGYVAKHMWIVKHFGKASKCEFCETKSAKRYEWANISGEYKREIYDYKQLCPSCHRKFDKGLFCKRGHEYTPENTYLRKEGWRQCKKCQTIRQRRFYDKNN